MLNADVMVTKIQPQSQSNLLGNQMVLFVLSKTSKDGKSIVRRDYPLMDCYRLMHAYFTGISTGSVLFNGFPNLEGFLKYHALATFDDLRYAYSSIPEWLETVHMTPEVLDASDAVKKLRDEKQAALFSHLIRDYDSEIKEAEREYDVICAKAAAEALGSYGLYPEVPSANAKIVGSIRTTDYGNLDFTWRAFHQPYDEDAKFFLAELDQLDELLRMNGLDIVGRFEIGLAKSKEAEDSAERSIDEMFFQSESERMRSDFTRGANTHWAEGEDGTSCSVIGYVFARD